MKALNPFTIFHAIRYVKSTNSINLSKSFCAGSEDILAKKIEKAKGKYIIITDKQFGLIQNNFGTTELVPNTKLPIHLVVNTSFGTAMIPMTTKQFDNKW